MKKERCETCAHSDFMPWCNEKHTLNRSMSMEDAEIAITEMHRILRYPIGVSPEIDAVVLGKGKNCQKSAKKPRRGKHRKTRNAEVRAAASRLLKELSPKNR